MLMELKRDPFARDWVLKSDYDILAARIMRAREWAVRVNTDGRGAFGHE
jgi:hypothetical protein